MKPIITIRAGSIAEVRTRAPPLSPAEIILTVILGKTFVFKRDSENPSPSSRLLTTSSNLSFKKWLLSVLEESFTASTRGMPPLNTVLRVRVSLDME